MTDSEPRVREAALEAISGLSSVDEVLTGALLRSLQSDGAAQVRAAAAHSLGLRQAADPRVVEALVAALTDAEPAVRRQAVRALGKLGPDAYRAADALERIARDPQAEGELRMHAAYALRGIGAPAANDLPEPRSFIQTNGSESN